MAFEFPEHSSIGKLERLLAKFTKDEISSSINVIDVLHAKIHNGQVFAFSHLFVSVANNANADILIITGNKDVHATMKISGGGNSHAYLYEGTTVSASGSVLDINNKNRHHAQVEEFRAFHTPTGVTVGDQLSVEFFPGGTGGGGLKVGSTSEERDEWEFSPNTYYLIRVANKSGGAVDISISGTVYESED